MPAAGHLHARDERYRALPEFGCVRATIADRADERERRPADPAGYEGKRSGRQLVQAVRPESPATRDSEGVAQPLEVNALGVSAVRKRGQIPSTDSDNAAEL